jgi:hypothetical protein
VEHRAELERSEERGAESEKRTCLNVEDVKKTKDGKQAESGY